MSRRVFLFGLLVVGLLIVSLYRAKYGARDTAAEIMAVDAQIEQELHQRGQLETELSHMSRREWIEEYARGELGMAPPRPEQIIKEDDLDYIVGEPVAEVKTARADAVEDVEAAE